METCERRCLAAARGILGKGTVCGSGFLIRLFSLLQEERCSVFHSSLRFVSPGSYSQRHKQPVPHQSNSASSCFPGARHVTERPAQVPGPLTRAGARQMCSGEPPPEHAGSNRRGNSRKERNCTGGSRRLSVPVPARSVAHLKPDGAPALSHPAGLPGHAAANERTSTGTLGDENGKRPSPSICRSRVGSDPGVQEPFLTFLFAGELRGTGAERGGPTLEFPELPFSGFQRRHTSNIIIK